MTVVVHLFVMKMDERLSPAWFHMVEDVLHEIRVFTPMLLTGLSHMWRKDQAHNNDKDNHEKDLHYLVQNF